MGDFSFLLEQGKPGFVSNLADGQEGLFLAELCCAKGVGRGLVHVCSDPQKLDAILESLDYFAPWLKVIHLPAWDCLPYDRVSPSVQVVAARIEALNKAIEAGQSDTPTLVLTTANALLQRYLPRSALKAAIFSCKPGESVDMDDLVTALVAEGFERTSTVREQGEFAVRGGILDVFVPGESEPVRLDFFGNTLESIRTFDPENQMTTGQLKQFLFRPMSEIGIDDETIKRFRRGYIEAFGAANREDALYQTISDGRRYPGMEHWLPLFYDQVESLFDYFDGFRFTHSHDLEEAVRSRTDQIVDHYEARTHLLESSSAQSVPYKPLPPEQLYLSPEEVLEGLGAHSAIRLSPFNEEGTAGVAAYDAGGRATRNFAVERASGANVFEAVAAFGAECISDKKKVLIAAWSEGSMNRLAHVLEEHGAGSLRQTATYEEFRSSPQEKVCIARLPLEQGFQTDDQVIVSEQDILGDRLVRRTGRSRKDKDLVREVGSLSEGDIVVHVDHGIARFTGLKTIEAAGAPHDCVELRYAGDDKLFLPVENIELLSRYGSSDTEVVLDRLGGVAWQARKAKLKKRLLEMAGQLIQTAAQRELRSAERLIPPDGLYDEFSARFPYGETEDQLTTIESVLDDLGSGRPMDRLVCGDVGFGKTEVALRAAFVSVMAGKQVAVVVPTTLLARQHFQTFLERFRGWPVTVRHASRLVSPKELAETKKGLKSGQVDIVIGTHALLGESVSFNRLGLLVIDEEQRFGVKHKERLKELRTDVHVLTLSATPIPRTLQLALAGVKELSLITTAPVDRMAVRTFITPFDPLTIREALLRERYRGGQSFYVCPRVSDIENRRQFLEEHVPELKVAIAHGQMSATQLDEVMNAFYDGQYDVLLSTTIVESGLDIPTANTLIVHRADMFGLAQLYQLRGRVGRSKVRAYAIMTLPESRKLSVAAERRLKVLQSLDTIGAGFELASHDLDIRGSGNLLGEEQSGQIREVGYELYQQMLEEAVAELKGDGEEFGDEKWSPQISIGMPVLIPESYVPDLQLRLGLYRRLSDIRDAGEIDAFGAELHDRFGPLPEEVEYLLKIVLIKGLCFKACVEKLDAGPKGAVISFRNNQFPEPGKLVQWISEQGDRARIRPDQSIVIQRSWDSPENRMKGVAITLSKIADFAGQVEETA